MNKKGLILAGAAALLAIAACNKKDSATNETDFTTLKTTVIQDFTNNIALKSYADLDVAAATLYTSITALNTDPTDDNLEKAKTNWKNMRSIWEQAEGFLFGPVEDNDYDPYMDTWPTDYVQMDSLLASSSMLEVADIKNVPLSLRGYHPIEYIIFGNHGSRKAADITTRQKKYMVSLASDLKDICHSLYQSWAAAPENYAQQVLNAGNGSDKYKKKQEVYIALVNGMADICDEVGAGKMAEPYEAMDSTIVESPYSGNSIPDFKNNIVGLQNVYLGRYAGTQGKGLHDLVAMKNKSLDNKIQEQIAAAISAFDNINVTYEKAIFDKRVQVKDVMDKLALLQTTLEDELKPFVMQYIQD
jgi:predicted lipoprotein